MDDLVGLDLYLGVDGGGTWTRAVLVDSEGRVVGQGLSGSSNRNHHTEEEVVANLRDALIRAAAATSLDRVRGAFLGMCGVSTDSDRQIVARLVRSIPELAPGATIDIENDTYTGLVGGLSGRPGMVLIAGTGSAVFGRNGRGETALCGGWGALADDGGSAYWLSVEAIKIAVKVEDGRLPRTRLHAIVFDFLGIPDEPRSLIDRIHNGDNERADLAKMAPSIVGAFREGDWAAQEIVYRAVGELSSCARAVSARLFREGEPCELILVGGLALSGEPFGTMLTDRIQDECANVRIVPAELSPDRGAALEALARAGIAITPNVLRQLSPTDRP